MKLVCDKLGRRISQTERGARIILKKEGVTNSTGELLKKPRKGPQRIVLRFYFCTWQIVTDKDK